MAKSKNKVFDSDSSLSLYLSFFLFISFSFFFFLYLSFSFFFPRCSFSIIFFSGRGQTPSGCANAIIILSKFEFLFTLDQCYFSCYFSVTVSVKVIIFIFQLQLQLQLFISVAITVFFQFHIQLFHNVIYMYY